MKLQVGNSDVVGKYKGAEWYNLDIKDHRGVDIIADASDKIPLETDSVDEIHCIHVLEHVTRDKYQSMLKEMYRVLTPGGYLYVETPNFMGIINNLQGAFVTGNVEAIHIWTTSVYGKSERKGMSHHWGFYEGLLLKEFYNQGFNEVVRLFKIEDMISTHYKQEPVLLMRGMK